MKAVLAAIGENGFYRNRKHPRIGRKKDVAQQFAGFTTNEKSSIIFAIQNGKRKHYDEGGLPHPIGTNGMTPFCSL